MKQDRKIVTILVGLMLLSVWVSDATAKQNPHGKLKWDCSACHSSEGWNVLRQPIDFNHSETGFPLVGAHATVKCRNCHTTLTFAHVGVACADCHTDIHRAQFGNDCQNCHTPRDWTPVQDMLSLHAERGFPLVGAHTVVDCDACHIRQGRDEYLAVSVECIGCHSSDYQATEDPNHAEVGFPTDCRLCHSPATPTWHDATFDHLAVAGYALRGAHASLDCSSCHTSSQQSPPTDCYGCHQTDFEGVDDPNHVTADFSHDCATCHSETAWSPATFDHNQTSFPLTGAHVSTNCTACHVNNQYTGTPTDCFSCHESDYNGTTDPDHAASGFGTDCTVCHNTTAWEPSSFDHNNTAFPLTGAHVSTNCTACHVNNQYTGTPTDCFSCHESDYNRTTDPDHSASGFGTDCIACHTTTAWEPSTFDHNNTAFPLTGAHLSTNCTACHMNNQYAGTPTDCFSCHESDFNGTTDPDHQANNFSHDCTECHTTTAWDPAEFDHASTSFPLTGAHVSVNCIDCHSSGYTSTPIQCFACHESDYNSAISVDHLAAGFPTDCEACHNTTDWQQTSWDHDGQYFPIYSGTHQQAWSLCSDCHVTPSDYQTFECILCHAHDKTTTDNDHSEVNDYSYVGTECYRCHPTGRAED